MVAGAHAEAGDPVDRGDHLVQRPALDQHVVDRRHLGVVLDAEGGGGVALRVEVDDEHLQPLQGQRRREVDRGGGLADAALLVGHRQDPGLRRGRQRVPHPAGEHPQRRLGGPGDRGVVGDVGGSSSGTTGSVTAGSFAVAVPLRSSGCRDLGGPGASRFHVKHRGSDRAGRRHAGRRSLTARLGHGARRLRAPRQHRVHRSLEGARPVFHVKHRPEARPSRRSGRVDHVGTSSSVTTPRRPRLPRRPRRCRLRRLRQPRPAGGEARSVSGHRGGPGQSPATTSSGSACRRPARTSSDVTSPAPGR